MDGFTRDSGKLIKAGFPVFSRSRCPVESFGRWAIADFQVPILLSGLLIDNVTVCPGDFIFGDYDGVLVIPQELTLKVLAECERVMEIEDSAREEFARGDDPVSVYARHKRL
jgi:regulator of RNase E activity RraA